MDIRETMLATVEASPTAVANHDKHEWLAIFTEDGIVNDPVGSALHQGDDQLSRFYDTFIAPNNVAFHPDHDLVCGSTVVRDVTLEIGMSGDVTLMVPAHLRYELASPSRVAGLYAHWELPTMVGQMLGKGLGALPVSGQLSLRLLKNQGLGGSAGFAKGFRRAGAAEKRIAAEFLADAGAGSAVPVTYGADDAVAASSITDKLTGWQVGKTIAAGAYVTATVTRGDERGVAMFEFAQRRLQNVRLYLEA